MLVVQVNLRGKKIHEIFSYFCIHIKILAHKQSFSFSYSKRGIESIAERFGITHGHIYTLNFTLH